MSTCSGRFLPFWVEERRSGPSAEEASSKIEAAETFSAPTCKIAVQFLESGDRRLSRWSSPSDAYQRMQMLLRRPTLCHRPPCLLLGASYAPSCPTYCAGVWASLGQGCWAERDRCNEVLGLYLAISEKPVD